MRSERMDRERKGRGWRERRERMKREKGEGEITGNIRVGREIYIG